MQNDKSYRRHLVYLGVRTRGSTDSCRNLLGKPNDQMACQGKQIGQQTRGAEDFLGADIRYYGVVV